MDSFQEQLNNVSGLVAKVKQLKSDAEEAGLKAAELTQQISETGLVALGAIGAIPEAKTALKTIAKKVVGSSLKSQDNVEDDSFEGGDVENVDDVADSIEASVADEPSSMFSSLMPSNIFEIMGGNVLNTEMDTSDLGDVANVGDASEIGLGEGLGDTLTSTLESTVGDVAEGVAGTLEGIGASLDATGVGALGGLTLGVIGSIAGLIGEIEGGFHHTVKKLPEIPAAVLQSGVQ